MDRDLERRLRDDLPGSGPGLPSFVGVAAFAAVCLFVHWGTEARWVPVLDDANLAFHEFGHPFVALFSERLSVYGGTLVQLALPLAAAFEFARRRQAAGVAFGLVWFGENLFNVARYLGDARAQLLPLVGGGEHDWTEILGRYGLLQSDQAIARALFFVATLAVALPVRWLWGEVRARG